MNPVLDRADAAQLLEHLQACDASFVPPLSSRVDLAAYAAKLHARARRVEFWDAERLVGLVALYADNATGFISNVSVLPEAQGRGLAGQLLKATLDLGRELKLQGIALEVHADNAAALALYRRQGFEPQPDRATPPTLHLHRELP